MLGMMSMADLIYQIGQHTKPGEFKELARRECEWLDLKKLDAVLELDGQFEALEERLDRLDPPVYLQVVGDAWIVRRAEALPKFELEP